MRGFSRRNLVLAVVLLALASAVAGLGYYRDEKISVREQTLGELKTVATSKAAEIARWRQERLKGIRLHATGILQTYVVRFTAAPEDEPSPADLLARLRIVQEAEGYENMVIAGRDGRILASAKPGRGGVTEETRAVIERVFAAREPTIGEIYRCTVCGHAVLDVAAPVVADDGGVVAALALQIDPETELYPLLHAWPGPESSAEALLVRRDADDVVFLSTLRHGGIQPLALRIPLSRADLPAAQAVLGHTGSFDGRDYRGVPVLAETANVPGSAWYVIAKVDANEAYAGLGAEGRMILVIVLLCMLLAAASGELIHRRRRHQAIERMLVAEQAQREAEQRLRAAQALNKAIVESIPQKLFVKNRDSVYLVANQAYATSLGVAPEEIVGRDDFAFFSLELAEGYRADDRAVMESGSPREIEERYVAQGQEYVIHTVKAPVRNDEGEVVAVLGLFEDVTASKRSESLLRARLELHEFQKEHSLAELLQKALDEVEGMTGSRIGFYHFVDADQMTLTLHAWSTRTEKEFCKADGKEMHYGIDQAGVWVDCVHERAPVIHNDYASLPHRKGMPEGHAEIVRELVVPIMRDGLIVAILGVGNKPSEYTPGDVETVSFLADVAWGIVEHTRAEGALRESEQRLRALYEELPMGYQSLDAEGRLQDVNPQWVATTGYSRHDVLGHALSEFLVDDSAKVFSECFPRFLSEGQVKSAELTMRKKDGTSVVLALDGCVAHNPDGSFRQTHCVLRDVTAEKKAEAERQRFEVTARQQQKLEAIGTLASGVAHEINNPLSVILNYGQLLLDAPDDPAVVRDFAGNIVKESDRVAVIVRNLLSFARQDKESHSPARVADIVEKTLSLMRALFRKDQIVIECDLPGDLPTVKCRSQQIQQVLMNLLGNARDALNERYPGPSGDKTIKIVASTFEREGVKWVRLDVVDRGNGIPPEVAGRVFDPFFTTKPRDKGTGLGLSISYGIVQEHHGELWFETRPEEGTTFHVDLRVDNGWSLKNQESA